MPTIVKRIVTKTSASRRVCYFAFTALFTGVLYGSVAPLPVVAEPPRGAAMSTPQFRSHMVGPILTFPTPFTRENEIDDDGVRRMINRALAYDEVQVVAMTSGNNCYKFISYDEAKELTRVVVETAGECAVTIASTGFWNRRQTLDYVRFAEAIGASAVQVAKPQETEDADVAKFYRDVAGVTRLPLVLHGNYSAELLRELVKIKSIAAMKEDAGLQYLIDRQIVFGDRLAIFPGGFDSRFLVGYPYGSKSYYSAFYMFAPELGHQFWKAIAAGDVQKAGEFVKRYDYPFLQKWTFPFWLATCEYFGACQRYCRPPERSFTDQQMTEVKAFWDALDVKPPKK